MFALIFTVVFYLPWAAACSIPALLLARYLPASRPWLRYLATVAVFTLLVAPSPGSATVAVVVLPFAVMLLASVVSTDPTGMAWALQEWPLWHAVAFPATLLAALAIFERLRPGKPQR